MSKGTKAKMFCGTPSYMSPEILKRKAYDGQASDMWALGVLLFVLLAGSFPFVGETDRELFTRIMTLNFNFPKCINQPERTIINRLLTLDPERRMTSKQLL